jgi:hypothetical protein
MGQNSKDTASVFVFPVSNVFTEEHRNLTNLTVWSDFLKHRNKKLCDDVCPEHFSEKKHSTHDAYKLRETENKFSEPGHSTKHEVDSAQSRIDRSLEHTTLFSPVGYLRNLNKLAGRKEE